MTALRLNLSKSVYCTLKGLRPSYYSSISINVFALDNICCVYTFADLFKYPPNAIISSTLFPKPTIEFLNA